ncbi:MAG: glycoside hydrolase family 3 N-terminal domain-containing protein [Pseudomonadota bacterium]
MQNATLEQKIAQKIILDIRFYNEDDHHASDSASSAKRSLIKLTKNIAALISTSCIGGVILFKENLRDIEQIIQLTNDLQTAAKQSALGLPLFLTADHEGGRVTRLPEVISTSFTGNMSVGATYQHHGVDFASTVGDVLARELSVLGINVNHAPVVDVNADSENPVINSRAFSDDPKTVAALAIAQVKSMQSNGVMATLKHFPGHGNTNVDSHTGLPCIDRNKEEARRIDLAPFENVLSQTNPSMIMTAHIQYPALDSTEITTKTGDSIVVPATMSKRLIHDYLRTKLNYTGLVVSDALDMAGISDYFTATQAVINCFSAGIDLAVMPIRVRSPIDLDKLSTLIVSVVDAVKSGQLDEDEITASFERICKAKEDVFVPFSDDVKQQVDRANAVLGCEAHRTVEQSLANEALSVVKGQEKLKRCITSTTKVLVMMPQQPMCEAMTNTLQQHVASLPLNETNLQCEDKAVSLAKIEAADVIIAGHIYPKQSPVELGGIEDIDASTDRLHVSVDAQQQLYDLLSFAKSNNKDVVFVSLRTPYDIAWFDPVSDICIASYAYNVTIIEGKMHAPAFCAIANALLGDLMPSGNLPVTLDKTNAGQS